MSKPIVIKPHWHTGRDLSNWIRPKDKEHLYFKYLENEAMLELFEKNLRTWIEGLEILQQEGDDKGIEQLNEFLLKNVIWAELYLVTRKVLDNPNCEYTIEWTGEYDPNVKNFT